MTVKELIILLQKEGQDYEVELYDPNGNEIAISYINNHESDKSIEISTEKVFN